MPDRDVQTLIMQAGEIRTESRDLRAAILDFQDSLRRGLFRATVQGIAMVIFAVIFAVSLLGYLTSKSWTCDPLSLKDGSLQYKVCDVFFPQTTQQVKYLKTIQQSQTDAAKALSIVQNLETTINDVKSRLNPSTPTEISPTGKRTCEILASINPSSPNLAGCP